MNSETAREKDADCAEASATNLWAALHIFHKKQMYACLCIYYLVKRQASKYSGKKQTCALIASQTNGLLKFNRSTKQLRGCYEGSTKSQNEC